MSNANTTARALIALILGLGCSFGASAAEAPSDAANAQVSQGSQATQNDQNIVRELGRVQTLAVLTKARVNLKELQDQLTPDVARGGVNSMTPIVQAAGSTLPNVRLIINDTAYFIFSDGSHATGKAGTILPGGWKVSSISRADRTVVVTDKSGHQYHLAMSNSAPASVVDSQPSRQTSTQQGGFVMSPTPLPPAAMRQTR